jgi:hypothetical protein
MFFIDCSTVIRGAPRVVACDPRLVVGTPRLVSGSPGLVSGAPRLVVGASRLLVGAPRLVVGVPRRLVSAPRLVVGAPIVVAGASNRSQMQPKCSLTLRGVPKLITLTALAIQYQSSEISVTPKAGRNALLGSDTLLKLTHLSIHSTSSQTLLEPPRD